MPTASKSLTSTIPGLFIRFDSQTVHQLVETAEQVDDGHCFKHSFVNVEKAYDSAIVDPYRVYPGKTFSKTPSQALLVTDGLYGTAVTIYLKLGDWMGWIALAGMAFFTFFSWLVDEIGRKT